MEYVHSVDIAFDRGSIVNDQPGFPTWTYDLSTQQAPDSHFH